MMRTLAVVSLLHICDQAAAMVKNQAGKTQAEPGDECNNCLQHAALALLSTKDRAAYQDFKRQEEAIGCLYPLICNQEGSDWENLSTEQRQLRIACRLAAESCTLKTPEDGLENIPKDPIIEIESNGPGDMKMNNEKEAVGGKSYWLGEEGPHRKGSPPAPQLAPAKEAGSTVVV